MPRTRLTQDDVGKSLVAADGNTLGMITDVRDGTPYIDPDPDALERIEMALDWDIADEEAYPMETVEVADVTDDEVRLE